MVIGLKFSMLTVLLNRVETTCIWQKIYRLFSKTTAIEERKKKHRFVVIISMNENNYVKKLKQIKEYLNENENNIKTMKKWITIKCNKKKIICFLPR